MITNKYLKIFPSTFHDRVKSEISSFLDSNDINEFSLGKLQEKMQGIITEIKEEKVVKPPPLKQNPPVIKPAIKIQKSFESVDNKSCSSERSLKSMTSRNSKTLLENKNSLDPTPRSIYHSVHPEEQWAAMVRFDSMLYKKEQMMAQVRKQQQMQKFKNEIDKQVQYKQNKLMEEQNEDRNYHKLMEQQMHNFDSRQNDQQVGLMNQKQMEKFQREMQIKEQQRARKKQEYQRRKQEAELLNNMKMQVQEEKDIKQQRKMMEREHFRKMKEENDKIKELEKMQKQQQKYQDAQNQRQICKEFDESERQRLEEINRRNQNARLIIDSNITSVEQTRKKMLETEENKVKNYLRIQERRIEKEKEYQKKLKEQNQQYVKEYLDRQVQENINKKKYEENLDQKQALYWQKNTNDFINEEKLRDLTIKESKIKNQQMILEQIALNKVIHRKPNYANIQYIE